MKLCIKCLEVRGDSYHNYCFVCGKRLFESGTVETEEAEKLIIKRIEREEATKTK